ncbi:MAG: phosphoribosyltransferase [Candidatus Hodarchaeales archaeon]
MNNEEITFYAPTWDNIENLAVKLYHSIIEDKYIPDIIAGISRGGIVPARILSDLFLAQGRKVTLSIMQIGFYSGIAKTKREPIVYQDLPGHIYGKKILLIDDVADSGVSLEFALKYLKMKKPIEVRVGTLYYKPWSSFKPHYYVKETKSWIIFPHERYEFMAEQFKTKRLSRVEAERFFIKDVGLPKTSVHDFLEYILKEESG